MISVQKYSLALAVCLFCSLHCTAQIFFTDQATALGINHQYDFSIPGGGVSFVDFNGDGWDDLTLATDEEAHIQFYQNNNGSFELLEPLVPYTGQTEQLLWVDYDNDGDKDLYVATFRDYNRLYENVGDLELVEVTEEVGLPLDTVNTYGAAFGDYDRDGWLDLYYGIRTGVIPNNTMALFRNNGDGSFSETTIFANAQDPGNAPFCSTFLDYNNDHWPDLYTANDRFTRNTLLKNNGDGTFSDNSIFSGTALAMNAMCVAP
ncbi:MAG: VCBS repeat-containing protein, partial [Bacteroidota bacterium]